MIINPSLSQKLERNANRIKLLKSVLEDELTKEQRKSFEKELVRRTTEVAELKTLIDEALS